MGHHFLFWLDPIKSIKPAVHFRPTIQSPLYVLPNTAIPHPGVPFQPLQIRSAPIWMSQSIPQPFSSHSMSSQIQTLPIHSVPIQTSQSVHPNLAINNPQHPNPDVLIRTPTIQFQLNVLANLDITNPQHPNPDIPIHTPTIRFQLIVFHIRPS
ncbi:hypothetical protein JB92DRAFT_2112150 [Gautieria morchelliformis]|nr:hypothetical protein JB92DRAFT_2112150 [Gautieria morchelliformis]